MPKQTCFSFLYNYLFPHIVPLSFVFLFCCISFTFLFIPLPALLWSVATGGQLYACIYKCVCLLYVCARARCYVNPFIAEGAFQIQIESAVLGGNNKEAMHHEGVVACL